MASRKQIWRIRVSVWRLALYEQFRNLIVLAWPIFLVVGLINAAMRFWAWVL